MKYKRYGEMFKKIRIQSGFTLSNFQKIGVAPSSISDFEHGKSMMGFEKVDECLQLMGVSLEEYEDFLNFYAESPTISLLYEIEEKILADNIDDLYITLAKAKSEESQYHIVLLLQTILGTYCIDDLNELIDFLYEAEIWGLRELYLFYFLIDYISAHDIINIIATFESHSRGIHTSSTYNRAVILMYCRAITTLSFYGFKTQAHKIIIHIQSNNLAQTMFLSNLFLGAKGFWTYQFKNLTEGKQMLAQFYKIQCLVGKTKVTNFYIKRFRKLLQVEDLEIFFKT
ncbi:Rgg/GadR/MutR family transcriptional regulator [Lactococcus garvieae]|uniref:Rgg/GadR/MutR family transcriptional regulator n=1 Tax=Lactococcus garvieae TaxID=1363 RepID=UPI0025506AC4|nr:Rgg/GadR/MutR family transcriptional regulator [Lactococcus garvieae]